MASVVIKKDGRKEPFDSEKVRKTIRVAAQAANLTEEKINELVEQVTKEVVQVADGKEEVATSEIRQKILDTFDTVEPSVSNAWREYDRVHKQMQ